jgi:hypothetical protein
MENVTLINKKLKELYGTEYDGRVRFRLVWSEDLIEKRIGPVYSPGGVIISEKELQECRKYGYIKDRYILENYNPAFRANPEIAVSDGYEPLFVFQKKGAYLKPYLWACERIINALRNPERVHRTEKMDYSEEELKEMKEQADYFDFLTEEGSSELGMKFTEGSATFAPEKRFGES